jgi:tetratricopeptide (TPR) repeat protein
MGLKRSAKVAAVSLLSMAVFGLGAVGFARSRVGSPRTVVSGDAAPSLRSHPVIEAGTLGAVIADLQIRVRSLPTDWRSFAALGQAYVQQARITADPSYYPKAEGVLKRSLALNGSGNFDALTGMAALSAARHDFSRALDWGERAKAVNPDNANVYAVIGDALVELGSYPEAFAAFQRMIELRPDLSTYARVSYAQELQGNIAEAVRAMRLALRSAGTPADSAWASFQIAELEWTRGHVGSAECSYREALTADPSYLPPHLGLAKVAEARGDRATAIRELSLLVERYPLPEYVIALGDLYKVAGEPELAARQYSLVHAEERLLQANGVNVDLEIALFDADHGSNVADGLARARAEWERRPSIHVADALAWTLYASRRFDEALTYANRALELGTRSALFHYHRAMIELTLDQRAAARRDLATALDTNSNFSILWSRHAARLLASLGGRP